MAPIRSLLSVSAFALCALQAGAKAKSKATSVAQATGGQGAGWNEKVNEEGKVVQELKIEAPSMTEEDQYGYKMPDRYKCDSCRAVMFHLDVALKKDHPKSRRMKQWEYTDLFDDACRTSFEGYGIKLHNGENTLSGPGLTHKEAAIAPGAGAIQMGGETWTKRLGEACRSIVYERFGEDEMYEKFREEGGLSEALCYKDLRDCKEGPDSPPKPKEEEKKPEKKAKKTEKKEKKEEKPKPKAEPKAAEPKTSSSKSSAKAGSSASDEVMDSTTFLRNMAVRNGLPSDEYLTARSEKDWEKMVVAMAGRIFNRVADSDMSGSCKAK